MQITKEIIAAFFGIGIFFLVIALFALQYASRARNIKRGHTWLFENWQTQLFDALFRDPRKVGKFCGVDVDKYNHQCALAQRENRIKAVIINKLCGYLIVAAGCIFGLASMNFIIIIVALVASFPLITLPVYFVERAAEKRRFTVTEELPRFLDMLHTALLIGMPVEHAIEMTARHLPDTVLAKELLKAMAETKVGAYNWQKALELLAQSYNVDILSDFVLDITNAYTLGSSITDSVARKSRDIKQTNLVAMKERASKLTNTILFPVLLFKIIPLLLLMGIPIMLQLQMSGF